MLPVSRKLASSSSSSSSITLLSLLISLQVQIIQAVVTLPNNVSVPAILVFGDSIVDPGNNNNLNTVVKCNFPPYGRDFMDGKPTGRFTNGKIPSDLIAQELGIKELVPAYLDPNLQPEDLITGVSFASGAAGYDPLTAKIASVLGLSDQLELFKEYIGKLKTIAGEEKTASIISESIYLMVAGSDDIANTYFPTPFRRLNYDVAAYTDLMLQGASSFVQELYGLGARRIGVLGAPPIGCVPSQRTLAGGTERACSEKHNQAEKLFNSKLSSELDRLNTKLPLARAVYFDIYNPLLDIIKNPRSFGFEVVTEGCCGTGDLEVSILCTDLSPHTCQDVTKYLFWDSYHPTEKAYEILVPTVFIKHLNTLFFCGDSPCS